MLTHGFNVVVLAEVLHITHSAALWVLLDEADVVVLQLCCLMVDGKCAPKFREVFQKLLEGGVDDNKVPLLCD